MPQGVLTWPIRDCHEAFTSSPGSLSGLGGFLSQESTGIGHPHMPGWLIDMALQGMTGSYSGCHLVPLRGLCKKQVVIVMQFTEADSAVHSVPYVHIA